LYGQEEELNSAHFFLENDSYNTTYQLYTSEQILNYFNSFNVIMYIKILVWSWKYVMLPSYFNKSNVQEIIIYMTLWLTYLSKIF